MEPRLRLRSHNSSRNPNIPIRVDWGLLNEEPLQFRVGRVATQAEFESATFSLRSEGQLRHSTRSKVT